MAENYDYLKAYEQRKTDMLDGLKSMYLEVFEDRFDSFTYLLKNLDNAFAYRAEALKHKDIQRVNDSTWYHKNNTYGLNVFADENENSLKGLLQHLEYLKDFDITFINISPIIKQSLVVSKPGALPEFISVERKYGTLEDLYKFCQACHNIGISVCFDSIAEYCKPENISKILSNPILFNKLVYDMLMFANLGVDIFKINCRPYTWNELGIDFPHQDQDVRIVKLLRKVFEIVCPGCIFVCDGEYNNGTAFSFYGSLINDECQLINNVSNKDLIRDVIETKDVGNIRNMIESLTMISRSNVFLNYIEDPWADDYRTLADIAGLKSANDRIEMNMAIDFDMLLQGYLMMIPGVPVLALGDEVGQVDGKSMDWSKTKLRFTADSPQYKIYNHLMLMKRITSVYEVFSRDASCYTYDTFEPAILGIVRSFGEKKLIGLFNFSNQQKTAWILDSGDHTDILTNDYYREKSINIKPYGMVWLYNQTPEQLEDM